MSRLKRFSAILTNDSLSRNIFIYCLYIFIYIFYIFARAFDNLLYIIINLGLIILFKIKQYYYNIAFSSFWYGTEFKRLVTKYLDMK